MRKILYIYTVYVIYTAYLKDRQKLLLLNCKGQNYIVLQVFTITRI